MAARVNIWWENHSGITTTDQLAHSYRQSGRHKWGKMHFRHWCEQSSVMMSCQSIQSIAFIMHVKRIVDKNVLSICPAPRWGFSSRSSNSGENENFIELKVFFFFFAATIQSSQDHYPHSFPLRAHSTMAKLVDNGEQGRIMNSCRKTAAKKKAGQNMQILGET